MSSVNKVILVGRLGKDPETKHLNRDNQVTNFSLATSERYNDKNGNKVENTEWHNIVCWNKTSEIAEKYLKKGGLIYVEGSLKTRSWDDKNGNKKYITEILANNFQMFSSKGDNKNSSSSQSSDDNNDEPNDDIPF